MQKIYLLFVALLLCCVSITHAQTRYWVGPANGLWSSSANWSATQGGGGGTTVPGDGASVIFTQESTVQADLSSDLSLSSLQVINSANVKLYTTTIGGVPRIITITGNSPAPNESFLIQSGAKLVDSTAGNGRFVLSFGTAATGRVDGTWVLTGAPGSTLNFGAGLQLPNDMSATTQLVINGSIIQEEVSINPATGTGTHGLMTFNSGSLFHVKKDNGATPHATWNASSTILITGAVTNLASISGSPVPGGVGNIVVNSPNIANPIHWALPNGLVIKGNLEFLNTNNQFITLASTISPTVAKSYTINGNLDISSSTKVYLARQAATADISYELQVDGNFNLAGSFDLREFSSSYTLSEPSVLRVKGSFVQTGAGYFGASATAVSSATELYVLEMNGTAAQTISSSTQTIDNNQNMVTLRLNNAAGVTLLTPLAVGKISWNSAGKGKLLTSVGSLLTINNTQYSDPTVINMPADNGYISGPVTRKTTGTGELRFPVGKGSSALRYVDVVPVDATPGNAPSSYTVEYFNAVYNVVAVSTPLRAVTNQEYWTIDRNSGSDARVILHLNGVSKIPGTTATDRVVVARFNSGTTSWESIKGTDGTEINPGNVTTGSVTSELLTSFSPFTLGIVPGNSLPVYLVDFNAKKGSGNTALLTWTVTSNSDPDRFEVLRSADGANFSSIGTVTATAGQLNFSFTDPSLPVGTTYYRLRMIDRSNVPMMSKIIALINGAEGFVITSLTPTVVVSQAKLSVSSSRKASLRLVVTDTYGRTILQQVSGISAGSQDIWINGLSILPAGTYQVTGYLDNGTRTSTMRFIKR
ncbi:MAG: hypothetical protein P0Y53_11170 [Candidatus Pseudobacter hemicellulosilyticus]|uniref:T9SS type A sorting domain-containing protein n=1 Tax=Candidatus Pseudobacter hemicellulosilyticus TaxID=3121375 RepID=A0AAJ6BHT1_9BACT|nr:MAG: hypothetical protein P0Y53_11170 [Pseudobacter sp.]